MRLVLQEPPLGPLSQSYHHLLSPKNSPNCPECTKVPELLGMHRTAWFSYRHLFGTFLMKWVLICPFGEKEYSWFINYSLASGETQINIHKSRAGQLFAAASFFTNFSWVLDFLSAFRTGPIISRHDICQKVYTGRLSTVLASTIQATRLRLLLIITMHLCI